MVSCKLCATLVCNDPLFLPFWCFKPSLYRSPFHFEEMIFPLVLSWVFNSLSVSLTSRSSSYHSKLKTMLAAASNVKSIEARQANTEEKETEEDNEPHLLGEPRTAMI